MNDMHKINTRGLYMEFTLEQKHILNEGDEFCHSKAKYPCGITSNISFDIPFCKVLLSPPPGGIVITSIKCLLLLQGKSAVSLAQYNYMAYK